jgi:hypothetical protein
VIVCPRTVKLRFRDGHAVSLLLGFRAVLILLVLLAWGISAPERVHERR